MPTISNKQKSRGQGGNLSGGLLGPVLVAMLASSTVGTGLAAQAFGPELFPSPKRPEEEQLARQAKEALSREEFEQAILAYEKLVKLAPATAEYLSDLGIAYFSAGRPHEAARALQQALKLKPALAQAHYYLGASLAESGRCQEALPFLKKDAPRVGDPHLKRAVEGAGLRCAMALDQEDDAVDFLRKLQRDFPKDPEVLYLSVHVYSDLSTRVSQRLLLSAPASYQVHLLNAEALEAQQKWDEAAEEYRMVLDREPHLSGIHFRLGRLFLSAPKTPTTFEQAKREFEEELKIDPRNAGAEYVLAEMARQGRNWPEAIEHFSRATQLDPTFADAFIGLGKSLVSAGRPSDAVAPLEASVKLQPDNPVAHYQLSFAFRRAGRREEADRELLAYRQSNDRARKTNQEIQSALLGRNTPAQTAEPPE